MKMCMDYACCQCIKLKTGCNIAGVVAVIEGIIKFVLGGVMVESSCYLYVGEDGEAHRSRTSGPTALALFCVSFALATLIAGVLLIIAIRKGKQQLIQIYLIIMTLQIFFSIVVYIIEVIYFPAVHWIFYQIFLALDMYLIMVVCSYYQERFRNA